MSDEATYQFQFQAKHQNREITEIAVRRPVFRDLKALDQVTGEAARISKMIELLTGLTAREVEEIRLEDVVGLGEIVGNFFAGLRAAATS